MSELWTTPRYAEWWGVSIPRASVLIQQLPGAEKKKDPHAPGPARWVAPGGQKKPGPGALKPMLSEELQEEAYGRWKNGEGTMAEIAAEYGVSLPTLEKYIRQIRGKEPSHP